MNYYPLFRVRSWNNGMHCMSFYILMGPTWVLVAPVGPHVGPMNLAIRDLIFNRFTYKALFYKKNLLSILHSCILGIPEGMLSNKYMHNFAVYRIIHMVLCVLYRDSKLSVPLQVYLSHFRDNKYPKTFKIEVTVIQMDKGIMVRMLSIDSLRLSDAYICINKLNQHWFRLWLVAYPNQLHHFDLDH